MTRIRWTSNRFREERLPSEISEAEISRIRAFHRTLPDYQPTPLRGLPALARELGVGGIRVKDESVRFGLKAFKVLGATYGLYRLLEERKNSAQAGEILTLATATDGNHGRAVAWAAAKLGHKAVVFVPDDMAGARREAIAAEGAQVRVVSGTYDRAVAEAERQARKHGWLIVSDTSYPGYERIPDWITRGYSTLFDEILEQLQETSAPEPSHVFLQAGVGGMASTGVRVLGSFLKRPRFVCVEPSQADGLLTSIRSPRGELEPSRGTIQSIMSGLNCALPSLQAWPILRAGMDLFLAVDDGYAEEAIRRLYFPTGEDPGIVAGEAGAAGLAGLLALIEESIAWEARRELQLNGSSEILLILTEGDTDPVGFQRIVS